jgi:hypothetical protein
MRLFAFVAAVCALIYAFAYVMDRGPFIGYADHPTSVVQKWCRYFTWYGVRSLKMEDGECGWFARRSATERKKEAAN